MSPYEEGCYAKLEGRECPYDPETHEGGEWLRGFRDTEPVRGGRYARRATSEGYRNEALLTKELKRLFRQFR